MKGYVTVVLCDERDEYRSTVTAAVTAFLRSADHSRRNLARLCAERSACWGCTDDITLLQLRAEDELVIW